MKITEVVGILGQDKNNIYIMIHGDKDDAYYIEKVSKETGDKRDGAFLPNVVEVYKISNDLIGCNTNLFVTPDLITLMEEEKLYNLDPFGNKLLDVRRYYIDYFLPKLIKQAITEIKPNLNINII